MVLKVQRLSDHATLPVRKSELAAGYDLAAAYDTTIPACGRGMVLTDLAISVPEKSYGRIAPRSGLAVLHGIGIGAGVIDEDYRGNVTIVLFNHGSTDFTIKKGDRVAQLILERICNEDVEEVDALPKSTRGEKGFGSTDTP